MGSSALQGSRLVRVFWRYCAKIALLGAAVVAAVAVSAGAAKAAPATIGTGVVVIDTNLADHEGRAAGTGMVLTSSGEVLTNNHVIRGATTLRVVVPGTGHSYAAKVVGYDVSADVAVIQITNATDLATIGTDSSSDLKDGDPVTAVGNAGGTGSLTSTTGTLTALNRSITVSDDQGGSESLSGLVQTSARLQPGDSGGPLLDSQDRAIAMDTAAEVSGMAADASTRGFAIPINRALRIAGQIALDKASTAVHVGDTAFLGVEVIALQAAQHGGSANSGATIAAVTRHGPAASAGLLGGDTITAVGGRKVSSSTALGPLILSKKPDTRVGVTYTDRFGVIHSATVKLGSGPPQ
jgi:S1-C subfamily serine protease